MDHALDPSEIFMMCLERSRNGTVVRVSSIVLQAGFVWLHRDYNLTRPAQITIVKKETGSKNKINFVEWCARLKWIIEEKEILKSKYYDLFENLTFS